MKSDHIKALGKAALIAALLNAASFSTSNAAFAEGIPSAGHSMPQALVESAKAAVVERFSPSLWRYLARQDWGCSRMQCRRCTSPTQ